METLHSRRFINRIQRQNTRSRERPLLADFCHIAYHFSCHKADNQKGNLYNEKYET